MAAAFWSGFPLPCLSVCPPLPTSFCSPSLLHQSLDSWTCPLDKILAAPIVGKHLSLQQPLSEAKRLASAPLQKATITKCPGDRHNYLGDPAHSNMYTLLYA